MDKRDTVRVFRTRLTSCLAARSESRTRFADAVGIDRSTLSQILSPANERLPRADTVAAMASVLQVSTDWLLGLSQEQHRGADVLRHSLQIEPTPRTPVDDRLQQWHAAAKGYKIRHVPANLPDLVKTPAVIGHEYQFSDVRTADQALRQSADRLNYMRLPETEMEISATRQCVEMFTDGAGLWRGLPVADRREQLQRMIALIEELYPTVRWFLFDGLARYSAPITIFGPQRAAVYLGQAYFVFNTTEHIRVLTAHFDDLIRATVVQPPDVAAFLQSEIARLSDG